MLAKFACASLAVKLSDVNLSNSWVVIYSSWSWSVVFFPVSLIFVLLSVFLTKLPVSVVWVALTVFSNSLYSVFLTTLLHYCIT